MAGGRGERFWPKSRRNLPKQFLSLTDDGKTMIQLTVERILPLVDIEDIYISTNKDYEPLVLKQLPNIPKKNKNCIVEGGKKLIATVGIEDLIIVDTEDATLICAKDSAGGIKKIIDNLKICNRDEFI